MSDRRKRVFVEVLFVLVLVGLAIAFSPMIP